MSVGKKKIRKILIFIFAFLIVKSLIGSLVYRNRNLIFSAAAHVMICGGYSELIKVQYYPEVYIAKSDYTAEDLADDYGYIIDESKTLGQKKFAVRSREEYSILEIPHESINVFYVKKYKAIMF